MTRPHFWRAPFTRLVAPNTPVARTVATVPAPPPPRPSTVGTAGASTPATTVAPHTPLTWGATVPFNDEHRHPEHRPGASVARQVGEEPRGPVRDALGTLAEVIEARKERMLDEAHLFDCNTPLRPFDYLRTDVPEWAAGEHEPFNAATDPWREPGRD